MNPNDLAKQFLDCYYKAQSSNRADLLGFYTENSCMSYNGEHCKGLKAIKEKIEGLGFGSIQYKFEPDFTVQPGVGGDALLIVVKGALQMDNEGDGFKFTQTFQLASNGNGGFYIHNDILNLLL